MAGMPHWDWLLEKTGDVFLIRVMTAPRIKSAQQQESQN
jgi:hypothetical protein